MTTCVPIGRWPFATVDVCTGGGKVWTEATILGVDQAKPLGAPFYLYTPNNLTSLPVCTGTSTSMLDGGTSIVYLNVRVCTLCDSVCTFR